MDQLRSVLRSVQCPLYLLAVGIPWLGAARVSYLLDDPYAPWVGRHAVITHLSLLCLGSFLWLLAIAFTRRVREADRWTFALFMAANLVYLNYFWNSSNWFYTNDLRSHLVYLKFMYEHWWHAPFGYSGQLSNHPPLYYALGALVIGIVKWFGMEDIHTPLRLLSWGCFALFGMYGIRIIYRLVASRPARLLACTLLLLWPSGIYSATKINNEVLLYGFTAMALFYLIQWYTIGKPAHLRKFILALCLGMLVKSNAIVLFLVFLCLVPWRLRALRAFATQRNLAVCGLAIALTLGLNMRQAISEPFHLITWAKHVGSQRTGRFAFDPDHYLRLNYTLMMQTPFGHIATDTQAGNTYDTFWNRVLKTSIFGEFQWRQPWLASFLNFLIFPLLLLILLPALHMRREEMKGFVPLWIFLVFSLMSLIAYAAWNNTHSSQDFRYVYPIIIVFAAFLGRHWDHYAREAKPVMQIFLALIPLLFVGLSIYFFNLQPRG